MTKKRKQKGKVGIEKEKYRSNVCHLTEYLQINTSVNWNKLKKRDEFKYLAVSSCGYNSPEIVLRTAQGKMSFQTMKLVLINKISPITQEEEF